jgi:uncharacterized ParB-like nuclease family protein
MPDANDFEGFDHDDLNDSDAPAGGEENILNKLTIQDVDIDLIVPNPWNPNEQDDTAFNRLVEELKTVGFIDPIQVVPMEDGKYRIIGGEHRYHAGRLLGYKTLPCVLLSDAKWKDEDLQKFVTVRLNMLRGKTNPEKMVKLYEEMAAKYGEAALQGLFAYTDTDAWDKLVKTIGKGLKGAGLPKEIADKFDDAAKEAKSVEDLSLILNHLFNKYGDTLRYSFMVFTYGGREHMYVAMNAKTKKAMDQITAFCKEQEIDLNQVMAPLAATWLKDVQKRTKELGKLPEDMGIEPNPFEGPPAQANGG